MRYKVNFHVVLYIISSYSTLIMGNHQAPINLSHSSSGSSSDSGNKNASRITKIANKFLTHDHHRKHDGGNSDGGHLASIINEQQQQLNHSAAMLDDAVTVTKRKNHTATKMGKLMDIVYRSYRH